MTINNINLHIEEVVEHNITTQKHLAIQQLLQTSFPFYPKNRSYFLQIPNFRYLVWNDHHLVGHLGVNHRIINLNGKLTSIFGVMDLCIAKDFQSNRIASQLIEKLETLAKKSNIDFLVLIAEKHAFYLENGFELVQNTAKWLMISRSSSLGIMKRKLDDCLMVKSVNNKVWEKGLVDFLGTMF